MPDAISLTLIYALIIGYGLGSIPFGLIIARLTGQGDIRKIGSGNIGATNVLRTGRKDLAFITLLLDAGKAGFAYFLVHKLLGFGHPYGIYAGGMALIGHCFPVWLGFKGGKGVALPRFPPRGGLAHWSDRLRDMANNRLSLAHVIIFSSHGNYRSSHCSPYFIKP